MSPSRRATIYLLLTTVLWGASFFTMDLGTRGLATAVGPAAAPSAFLFLRFALASAVGAALFFPALRAMTARAAVAGVVLSIPFYAGFILQTTAIGSTGSTVSSFLTSLMVVITPALGRLCFGERLSGSILVGAAISLGGVWILTDPSGGMGRGEWLTIACAVAFSFQIQLTNVLSRRHPPEALTMMQFLCGAAFSGATLLVLRVPAPALARGLGEPNVAWTVAFTATACSVVAMWVLNRYQRDLPASRAAVLYTLEPLFASLFAWGFVGEALTARKLAGGAVILVGNLACEFLGSRVTKPDGHVS